MLDCVGFLLELLELCWGWWWWSPVFGVLLALLENLLESESCWNWNSERRHSVARTTSSRGLVGGVPVTRVPKMPQ